MDNLPPKKCIFCGRGPITKEDVWPTWLTPHIPRDLPSYTASQSLINPDAEITTTRKKWQGDPRSRRAKCVCAKCNNEWMSRLQEHAKSVILKLANGSDTALSPHDQGLLTAWATMSTITAEYFNPATATISSRDRDKFWKTEQALKNSKIWIGHYQRGNWKPHSIHYAWGKGPASALRSHAPKLTSQTTTLVFGELFLHVAYSQNPNVVRRMTFPENIADKLLKQIWPRRAGSLRWPPRRTMTDDDASRAAILIYLSATGLLLMNPVSHS